VAQQLAWSAYCALRSFGFERDGYLEAMDLRCSDRASMWEQDRKRRRWRGRHHHEVIVDWEDEGDATHGPREDGMGAA
jgi:hypothetical protein